MTVFVDTSALLAVLIQTDQNHAKAATAWERGIEERLDFVTSNYVVVELLALVQRRLGLQTVRAVVQGMLPVLRVLWVDESLHELGLASVLASSRGHLSLVDGTSFAAMRQHGIDEAFAFDRHFSEQGFSLFA